MRNFFNAFLFLSITFSAFGQKASDVLENGIRVGTDNLIIYKYNSSDKTFKYGNTRSLGDITKPTSFTDAEEGNLFLCSRNAVNIYRRPLNPLNYSFESAVVTVSDPINEAAATALSTIINTIPESNKTINLFGKSITGIEKCNEKMIKHLLSIEKLLNKDKKEGINKIFNKLKALDFAEQEATTNEFKKIKEEKKAIDEHFEAIKKQIEDAKVFLDEAECESIKETFLKMQFNLFIQNFSSIYQEQNKRMKNLENAFEVVEKEITKASVGGGDPGLRWCILLKEVTTKKGEISTHTLQVFESGYSLSSENEIVASSQKEVAKINAKFRRFQRFVPEVSVGTAYTFFKYYEYGTTTDDTGQQYVAAPTEKEINNLNIATMVNFTYYIEDSSVHPFWQIGAGANAEVPTLLTGFGLRGVLGTNRISISGGIAMTWIKELDSLNVGDEISGTSDIDNDLKQTFSWPPKAYIGLQYNF